MPVAMAAAQAQQLVRDRARSAGVDELMDLLDKYEEHQPLTAADEYGKLPLLYAAEANPHYDSVKLLIDRNNATLNEKCDLEMLPIHWAWCVQFLNSSADSGRPQAHLLPLCMQQAQCEYTRD